MKATFVAIIVAVLTLAVSASAQESSTSEVFDKTQSGIAWTQNPTAFRGISFGGTEADLVATLGPVKCRDLIGGSANVRECRATKNESRMIVNGVPMEDFYQFHDGKLVEVRLMAQTAAFAALPPPAPSYTGVLAAFTERYGPPTETWKTRHKGVRSVNHTLAGQPTGPYVPYESVFSSAQWKNDQMEIIIGGYGDAEFSSGLIQTNTWARERDAASKKPTTSF